MSADKSIVYVIGAGLSAGLGFPTISNLLPSIWKRLENAGVAVDLGRIIRFHHPEFNPSSMETFPDIEQLLSEMQANSLLFDSSRPATGAFTASKLDTQRKLLLQELAAWFHELQVKALENCPTWLTVLAENMKKEKAQIISFNWDLVLDEILFGEKLGPSSYGLGIYRNRARLIKPHGSLNWYESHTGQHLKADRKFRLWGKGKEKIFAFKEYRAPKSKRREYMPLIIPPIYQKTFERELFKYLWQETVSVLSTATEVRFLGYSLPTADFHARFIMRCGFHNQESGALLEDGERAVPTGRAKVLVVDPDLKEAGFGRIEKSVGWKCELHKMTVKDWVSGSLKTAN